MSPLIALLLLTGPAFEHRKQTLPYSAEWGQYRVVVEHYKPQPTVDEIDDAPMRIRIADQRGHTLKEVRDYYSKSVKSASITAKGAQDLIVHTYSGGAYSSNTTLIFTKTGGLRNILHFSGIHLSLDEARDLNHDGRAELIGQSPALREFSGWSFSRCKPIDVIFQWQGHHLVDVTSRFPAEIMKGDRAEFLRDLKESEWAIQGAITGYYPNMHKVGRDAEARKFLKKHLSKSLYSWFRRYQTELNQAVERSKRVMVDNRKVIDLNLDNP